MAPSPTLLVPLTAALRVARRAVTEWLTEGRITALEVTVSASADAFAELDAQLDAVEAHVRGDDAADAAEIGRRTARIRALLDSVNPEHPAPSPGEDGALEPDPAAPTPAVDGAAEASPDA